MLEGHTLNSGWLIGERIAEKIGATGANFGVCYKASRADQIAFVKAVDFRRAFSESDLFGAVAELATHAQWEKDVLEYCGEHGLSRLFACSTTNTSRCPLTQGTRPNGSRASSWRLETETSEASWTCASRARSLGNCTYFGTSR